MIFNDKFLYLLSDNVRDNDELTIRLRRTVSENASTGTQCVTITQIKNTRTILTMTV